MSMSEQEILRQIMHLQKQLEENNISREEQAQMIRKIMPALQGKEKARLMKIVEQLKL